MPKRLILCCDGTWNRPDQTSEGVAAPTNVTRLKRAIADRGGDREQLAFYEPGVGTRRFERIRGGAFGLGLSRNVRDCYRFLVENYEPADELFFFGFSRGAFTARSTVGLVRNSGILRDRRVDLIKAAYKLYRDRDPKSAPKSAAAERFREANSHPDARIHFIGVWDTVGALGIPIDGFRPPILTRRWSFHDTDLSRYVDHAYQALSIDERRRPFKPTLWNRQKDAGDQRLEQVWFAGVHSDVGGGYRNQALAGIALLWMAERARACGLEFEPGSFGDAAPDALGEIHDSLSLFYRLMGSWDRVARRDGPLEANGEWIASSAVRRRRKGSNYRPPGLDGYIRDDTRVTEVEDGG